MLTAGWKFCMVGSHGLENFAKKNPYFLPTQVHWWTVQAQDVDWKYHARLCSEAAVVQWQRQPGMSVLSADNYRQRLRSWEVQGETLCFGHSIWPVYVWFIAEFVCPVCDENIPSPTPTCGVSWLSGSVRDVQARDHGFDPQLRWICSSVVLLLLGKALCSHLHSLDPGVSGYLVGQWRRVCLNSSVRRKWQPGYMLPGELRWLMNEQVLWPGGNCVKSGEWRFALDTRL